LVDSIGKTNILIIVDDTYEKPEDKIASVKMSKEEAGTNNNEFDKSKNS